MRVGKYMISMLLCVTLTACRVDGTSYFQFKSELEHDSEAYIITLDQLIKRSDYIVLAKNVEKKIEANHYTVVVDRQLKGNLDMVNKQLVIVSTTPLTNINAQYFLFLQEQNEEAASTVYQLIIHPNPIVNNAFMEGPFAEMSYKDIRSEVQASINRLK